jgi:DNA-binding IclR family transcriptional regulator
MEGPAYPVKSVDNALRLLVLLGERQQLTLSEAAAHLGVAKSTAHRLLAELLYRGFAVQDGHRLYRRGPRLALAGPPDTTLRSLAAAARPYLHELRRSVNETVHVMVLEGNSVRFVDGVEDDHELRVGLRIGVLLPAHCTAGGKALLAELPPARLSSCYPRGLPLAPGDAIRDLTGLQRHLVGVRRRGYATNINESKPGVSAVGVCVRSPAGDAVAACAFSVPSARSSPARLRELAVVLRDAATRMSGNL